VKARSIFAGALAAMLLCVSSLAAACDLSCGFARQRSDCHSTRMTPSESGSPEMTMADMSMPGMTMPENSGDNSISGQTVSPSSKGMPTHAALVDMGACERQSCDQTPVLASKSNHTTFKMFEAISKIPGSFYMEGRHASFYESRDDLASFAPSVFISFNVTLRI
jgi:hypothetical protein